MSGLGTVGQTPWHSMSGTKRHGASDCDVGTATNNPLGMRVVAMVGMMQGVGITRLGTCIHRGVEPERDVLDQHKAACAQQPSKEYQVSNKKPATTSEQQEVQVLALSAWPRTSLPPTHGSGKVDLSRSWGRWFENGSPLAGQTAQKKKTAPTAGDPFVEQAAKTATARNVSNKQHYQSTTGDMEAGSGSLSVSLKGIARPSQIGGWR